MKRTSPWERPEERSAGSAVGIRGATLPEMGLSRSEGRVGRQLAVLVEAEHLAREASAGAVDVLALSMELTHDSTRALQSQLPHGFVVIHALLSFSQGLEKRTRSQTRRGWEFGAQQKTGSPRLSIHDRDVFRVEVRSSLGLPRQLYHGEKTCPVIHWSHPVHSRQGHPLHHLHSLDSLHSLHLSIERDLLPGKVRIAEQALPSEADEVSSTRVAFAVTGQGEVEQSRPTANVQRLSRLVP